ncbi:MAG: DNA gyrase subunit A [Gemmatimonadaceae bacterium]|jgi:DNA gyrase/topoisomerase IV subunit B
MASFGDLLDEIIAGNESEPDFLDSLLENAAPPAKKATTAAKKAAPAAKKAAPPAKKATTAAKKAAPPAKKATTAAKKAAPAVTPPADLSETGLTEADAVASASNITISSMLEHVKTKGMWAGSLTPVAIPDLLGAVPAAAPPPADEEPEAAETSSSASETSQPRHRSAITLVAIERAHTPALLKAMDELVVNATDHATGQAAAPPRQRVTRIDITYEAATGRMSVFNDGPGIPVVVHAEASATKGRPVYTVEVNFAWFLAGTNIRKDPASVKGGINGLGAKVANAHAREFVVETLDDATRQYYRQIFRDRLGATEPALVVDLRQSKPPGDAASASPHTRVSFLPAYAALGYKLDAAGRPLRSDAEDFAAWLRLRAHQAAAYVGPRVAVTFNGERCGTTSAAALASAVLASAAADDSSVILSGQARAAEEPYKAHPWNVAVIALSAAEKKRRGGVQNMAIVNGVVSNKGSHLQYLRSILSEAVEAKLRRATKGKKDDKKLSVTETLGGVRIVLCGAIPAAGGADWTGQRKDELSVPKKTLERYALTATFLRQAADTIAEQILIGTGAKSQKFVHDKYTPAGNAKKAQRAHTLLMVGEGDSALTLLRAGLTQKRGAVPPGGPSFDWCGTISVQGVIVNAAREVTEVETSSGATLAVRSKKLQENERLRGLADAMGLRYDRTYATPAELATLNYGQLVLCVDQDLDGTGKIAALILVWIHIFWPELIRAGRVGRFMTPLVRMFPLRGAAPPLEFFYEEELRRWLETNPGWAESYQKPKYYKGLAGHDESDVPRMFTPEAFRRSLYTYTLDDGAAQLFRVYFGADPALRKDALVTPVAHLSYEEATALHRARQIPVGRVQLEVDTKSYKNDAIKRQIPGVADGLNPARRKILLGAIMRFESAAKELKVFQLGGYVADRCFYHHGDASLNATIVHMAQAFPGARAYPYLVGVGQFGDRHGADAGSPRYIGVKLSPLVSAAFPPADRWHLAYVFEDGERAEPQMFVPVAPMAVLESYNIVSEGWRHNSFGRDYDAVMALVEAYIGGDPELLALGERLRGEGAPVMASPEFAAAARRWPLPASLRQYPGGELRTYKGVAYSFGAYTWDAAKRTATVTQLPIGVTTAQYLKTLGAGPAADEKAATKKPNARAEFIESVVNRSTVDAVELRVVLREGAFERVSEAFGDASIDALEDMLMLRESLRPHLNYYGEDGGVREYGSDDSQGYLAAVLTWAPIRRQLYVDRLGRERIVASLRIRLEEETLRYIGIANELDLASLPNDAAASRVLAERGFARLDSGLLHRPEYTPNADLRRLVLEGPGISHDYLLNLRERDLVRAAAEKRAKALEALRAELAAVEAQLAEQPVAGASVWRRELETFRRAVARGIETAWKFK